MRIRSSLLRLRSLARRVIWNMTAADKVGLYSYNISSVSAAVLSTQTQAEGERRTYTHTQQFKPYHQANTS